MRKLSFNQARALLSRESWYAQAGAVKGLYVSYPWSACLRMTAFGKMLPVRYHVALYLHDNIMEDYITRPSLESVARFYARRCLRNPHFLARLLAHWRTVVVPAFLAVHHDVRREKLTKLPETALLSLFRKLSSAYLAVWYESIFLDGFDAAGEQLLQEALQRAKRTDIPSSELDLLATPPEPSLLQQERLRLLAFAEKIVRSGPECSMVRRGASYRTCCARFPWIRSEAEQCSALYFWTHNDYADITDRTPSDFFALARRLVIRTPVLHEERRMRAALRALAARKRAVIRERKIPPSVVAVAALLSLLGNFRDLRKSVSQMANVSIRTIVEALHHCTGIPVAILEELFYWEILNGTYRNKRTLAIAQQRQEGTFYVLHAPRTYDVWNGRAGRKLFSIVKESVKKTSARSGRTAFPGHVRGTVRLVMTKKDFAKVRPGDILVAPNTRPEFVPVMRIAGAIVTEEGGVTSHAAIVSRELHVPCIVGMQAATSLFHDGDLVSVDAGKGTVEKV